MKTYKEFLFESDDGYMYHATNHYNLYDIINDGKLKTHKPSFGTDQQAWPDGSVKKRSYWTNNKETAKYFHPEEGNPVLIRSKLSSHSFKKEHGTGDFYLESPIDIKHLETFHNGEWKNLKTLGEYF